MNRNNAHITVSGGQKTAFTGQKPAKPLVQGVASSHGVKLSVNMTPDDKKKLLVQLEEWRKSKKEKIAAAMLAKQKQGDKSKMPLPLLPLKNKPGPVKIAGSQERLSVFERLYRNEKIKKPEAQTVKESSSNKTNSVPHAVSDKINITETESTPYPISNDIKIVQTISDLPLNIKRNEYVENNPPAHSANDGADIAEMEPATCMINDQNKESAGCHENVDEVEILAQPPAQPVNDQSKEETFKTPLLPVSGQIKSTVIKPPSLSISNQIKSVESKPIKSGLGRKTLPGNGFVCGKPRRSLSMMFHQKRKEQNNLRRSISAQNITKTDVKTQKADPKTFHTLPSRHRVSEISAKGKTPVKPGPVVASKETKPLTSTHLRAKLEDWLKVNGHPLEGYRHLRCFGIGDGEKSVLATPTRTVEDSSENSIKETHTPERTLLDDSNKENITPPTPPTVIRQVSLKKVEKWLEELHRLIVELNYPSERCEEWLAAIRNKCNSCTQLPIYWECLAGLDESKGDIKSAIADYETAIIKGGEVESVGNSLEQLFDKMVLESKKPSKPKLEHGLDPKNIFKSSVIKFALQQKTLNLHSSQLEPGIRKQLCVVTPVRRSARNHTPSKSTKEVHTLTPELRRNVTFKLNESLLLN